jgi:hypothetical protein
LSGQALSGWKGHVATGHMLRGFPSHRCLCRALSSPQFYTSQPCMARGTVITWVCHLEQLRVWGSLGIPAPHLQGSKSTQPARLPARSHPLSLGKREMQRLILWFKPDGRQRACEPDAGRRAESAAPPAPAGGPAFGGRGQLELGWRPGWLAAGAAAIGG